MRTLALTAITMVFFAANSVLARLALREGAIDAGSFTAVRMLSGAAVLALLAGARQAGFAAARRDGSWTAAIALAVYAFPFSFAYVSLEAGVGALVLFGTVQATMIGAGLVRGERPRPSEWLGLSMALGGLAYLVSPGLTAPPLAGTALMAVAGAAWGWYSLAAKGVRDPVAATTGNFLRAAPLIGLLTAGLWFGGRPRLSALGIELAALSGAVTSGIGYAIWYAALKGLSASRGAIVQLTIPVLAAVAGILFLGEAPTLRLAVASAVILGGVALAVYPHQRSPSAK